MTRIWMNISIPTMQGPNWVSRTSRTAIRWWNDSKSFQMMNSYNNLLIYTIILQLDAMLKSLSVNYDHQLSTTKGTKQPSRTTAKTAYCWSTTCLNRHYACRQPLRLQTAIWSDVLNNRLHVWSPSNPAICVKMEWMIARMTTTWMKKMPTTAIRTITCSIDTYLLNKNTLRCNTSQSIDTCIMIHLYAFTSYPRQRLSYPYITNAYTRITQLCWSMEWGRTYVNDQ